jgi:hypothetical protein
MMKNVMIAVAVMVLSASVQAATIGTDTIDPMRDGSLWDGSAGSVALFFDQTVLMGGLDPQDTESPAMVVQRWWPDGSAPAAFTFDYQADTGLTFSNVNICFATMSWDCPSVSYEDGNGSYVAVPATLTPLGAVSNWTTYMATFDLSGISADRIRVTLTGDAWYTPMISSVAMTVVPEPATLAMLMLGGVAMCRRHRK